MVMFLMWGKAAKGYFYKDEGTQKGEAPDLHDECNLFC